MRQRAVLATIVPATNTGASIGIGVDKRLCLSYPTVSLTSDGNVLFLHVVSCVRSSALVIFFFIFSFWCGHNTCVLGASKRAWGKRTIISWKRSTSLQMCAKLSWPKFSHKDHASRACTLHVHVHDVVTTCAMCISNLATWGHLRGSSGLCGKPDSEVGMPQARAFHA